MTCGMNSDSMHQETSLEGHGLWDDTLFSGHPGTNNTVQVHCKLSFFL